MARKDTLSSMDELQVGLDHLSSITNEVISFHQFVSSLGYMIAAHRCAKLLHSTSWEASTQMFD